VSKEHVTVDELLEAAKAARDLEYDLKVRAEFVKAEAQERNISFNELVNQEAMALGEHMLRLTRVLRIGRLLGDRAVGMQREKHKTLYDYDAKFLITPVLMKVEEEVDGETVTHGWKFRARAARDNNSKLKPLKVMTVTIIDHTEVVSVAVEPVEEEVRSIKLQAGNKGGEIVPIPYFIVGDPDSLELLDIYALLHMARQELGDKKAK
jgi:hypothetical protein